MRVRFLLLSLLFGLAGCSQTPFHTRSHAYVNESGVIPTTKSVLGAQLITTDQYYPVPPIPSIAVARQTPSIVPPASNLQRFAKAKKEVSSPQLATLETRNSETVLAVKENINQAWKALPEVLSNTPYHILDEDRSVSSYFVLDTLKTNGQITESTPIYRVLLKPDGKNTVVEVVSRDDKPVSPEINNRILGSLVKSWHG